MFSKRSFLVKVVKDPETLPESEPIDLQPVVNQITGNIAWLIGAYVTMDFVRQTALLVVKARLGIK